MNNQREIKHYQQVKIQETVSSASPHRLVQMLMEGAIERIAGANFHLNNKNYPEKCLFISKAIDIINGLRGSLNFEKGGEIAEDFERLYEFMVRRLLEANRHNDCKALSEVSFILKDIKSAWDMIPDAVKLEHQAHLHG